MGEVANCGIVFVYPMSTVSQFINNKVPPALVVLTVSSRVLTRPKRATTRPLRQTEHDDIGVNRCQGGNYCDTTLDRSLSPTLTRPQRQHDDNTTTTPPDTTTTRPSLSNQRQSALITTNCHPSHFSYRPATRRRQKPARCLGPDRREIFVSRRQFRGVRPARDCSPARATS